MQLSLAKSYWQFGILYLVEEKNAGLVNWRQMARTAQDRSPTRNPNIDFKSDAQAKNEATPRHQPTKGTNAKCTSVMLFRTHHETEFCESARLAWWRIRQVWTQMFMYSTACLVTVACGNHHLLSAVTAGYAVGNSCDQEADWYKPCLLTPTLLSCDFS